jgi:hypothetical protein
VPTARRRHVRRAAGRPRQRDAARPSFEQLDAEIGFEGGDVMAQRRLRDVKRLRCPRQHAGIANGDEIPQLPQSERHRNRPHI